MDPNRLTRMHNLLRYSAANSKDDEKREASGHALEVYNGLSDPSDRHAFLEQFESSGGGKTAVSLKFATKFKGSISSNKTVGFEVEENFYNRRCHTAPEEERAQASTKLLKRSGLNDLMMQVWKIAYILYCQCVWLSMCHAVYIQ